MMTSCLGDAFRVTDPLWGEDLGSRWIQTPYESHVSDVTLSDARCKHTVRMCRFVGSWWDSVSLNFLLILPLLWRHNGYDGVSNHQPHECLLNRKFSRRSKKTSKLRLPAYVREIHRRPVNSPHKWPVTRKMFPFDDVIVQDDFPGIQAI